MARKRRIPTEIIRPAPTPKEISSLNRSLKEAFISAFHEAVHPLHLQEIFSRLAEFARGPQGDEIVNRDHPLTIEERKFQLEAIKLLHKIVAGNQPLVQLNIERDSSEASAAIFELLAKEKEMAQNGEEDRRREDFPKDTWEAEEEDPDEE